ncbi:hypothetical protein B0T19DRAFT_301181 [Cercophora scortea]|uniref:Uncharacterized protein n=1 Tax=Cercophora scortea TaxID=314031 RepID=A0AAE0I3F7_9PEZI|nr:hypothetical protein B0T19DRAFT_301181 [Cercophora scortea]
MEKMAQQPRPTFINLPQPSSRPDTPSEMPGTPTSTTTSLSALSTTAIKDGRRGFHGHQHKSSLEAERADRISRLPGMPSVSTSRGPPGQNNAGSPQTTPTSTTALGGGLTVAFFDAGGQPVAANKMSTVGTASATESTGTETRGGDNYTLGERDDDEEDDDNENDEEMSLDAGDPEAEGEIEMDSASTSGYMGEDMDNPRSLGGFEDRMSDDGSASLVGFGEGAGSTVSGPIYHRRLPGQGSSAGAMMAGVLALERSNSGLSEAGGRRDTMRGGVDREAVDTPVSQSAVMERREALMVDGVALDGTADDDKSFIDTSTQGPVPVPPATGAARQIEQRSAQSHRQGAHAQPQGGSGAAGASSREVAESILRDRLDNGESRVGNTALRSPKGEDELGRFYFEDQK